VHLSSACVDLIKEFEAYKRPLSDGRCIAYRCVVGRRNGQPVYDGKWTLGWGCTEGVTEGMVWTREEAEEALRRELNKAEAIVNAYIRAPTNQNQYDALGSFAYNVGEGNFRSSSLVRRFNAGDVHAAADVFDLYVNSNGVRNVPGLITRRAREKALFLTPVVEGVHEAHVADLAPAMPQSIDPPSSAEEHASAHEWLEEASTQYSLHGDAIRTIGWGSIPGALAVWQWVQNPLHAMMLMTGVALAALVGIELSRLHQRNKLVGG
jgi:lysozyme